MNGPMRRVAIVGAGQAGLLLGFGLPHHGFQVTLVSKLAAKDLRSGRVRSTQCLWGTALGVERAHGFDLWAGEYTGIGGFRVRLTAPGSSDVVAEFQTLLQSVGQSVDQRVKFAAWLELFEERGGLLVRHEVDATFLASLADTHDLVVVTAGRLKGELADLFPVDDVRSPHAAPQRVGGVIYVHGRQGSARHDAAALEELTFIPEVGEFFVIPGFTLSGVCDIICLEGVLAGPCDRYDGVRAAGEIFEVTRDLVRTWLPWERDRCRHITLTDTRAAICGGFAPVTRVPVGRLENGRPVLALGDSACLLDPVTAQGGTTPTAPPVTSSTKSSLAGRQALTGSGCGASPTRSQHGRMMSPGSRTTS